MLNDFTFQATPFSVDLCLTNQALLLRVSAH